MKGTCSMCGLVIRSRRSDKGTAKQNFLKAVRKHVWKQHRTSMINRIKAGKAKNQSNPELPKSVKDIIDILGIPTTPREWALGPASRQELIRALLRLLLAEMS